MSRVVTSQWLGYLGLIPFLGFCAGFYWLEDWPRSVSVQGFVIYSLAIFCFLAGALWGQAQRSDEALSVPTLLISNGLYAGGHDDSKPSFEGLISSEVFDLDGKMDMHVERRESCGADTPKHFHPAAGTLVYVLDGASQSKSTGQWRQYKKNEYWFERADWVHGGEDDQPVLGEDDCQSLLVIRITEKDKEHTVFIE